MGPPSSLRRPHPRRPRHVRNRFRVDTYWHFHRKAAQVRRLVSHIDPLLNALNRGIWRP